MIGITLASALVVLGACTQEKDKTEDTTESSVDERVTYTTSEYEEALQHASDIQLNEEKFQLEGTTEVLLNEQNNITLLANTNLPQGVTLTIGLNPVEGNEYPKRLINTGYTDENGNLEISFDLVPDGQYTTEVLISTDPYLSDEILAQIGLGGSNVEGAITEQTITVLGDNS